MILMIVCTTGLGTASIENKSIFYDKNNLVTSNTHNLLFIIATVFNISNWQYPDHIEIDTILIEGNGHTYDKDDCNFIGLPVKYYIWLDYPGEYKITITVGSRTRSQTITLSAEEQANVIFQFLSKDASVSGTDYVSGLAEEPVQKNNINNEKMFRVVFGVIIAHGFIRECEKYYYGYTFICEPVTKLTLIGIGGYNFENNFYMKTFTNVTKIEGHILRELIVTSGDQYFITFYNPLTNYCFFYTYP